jgi:hypothetical protein
MPFDPSLPQNNSPLSATMMRSQFNELKALIDALPAGVTQQQLTDAINALQSSVDDAISTLTAEINSVQSGSANNVNGIEPLDNLVISDPPAQGEVQTLMVKLNDLINGSHR